MVTEELINVAELIRRIKEGPCSSLNCSVTSVKVSVGKGGDGRAVSSLIEVDLVRDKVYLTFKLKASELTCLIKLEVTGSVSVSELRRLSSSITELLNSLKP
ncbi:hypothetical protein [Caldivirga sp. UBA161]|uniref:hypothetical protein n=1 Tax=Caldivirga sp. UBA161 TaxID=1915569 RepID=UPI0025BB4832|nr:hypothetical protein [Caldivirga sp. UBA161]